MAGPREEETAEPLALSAALGGACPVLAQGTVMGHPWLTAPTTPNPPLAKKGRRLL